jgi:hypothetical protein
MLPPSSGLTQKIEAARTAETFAASPITTLRNNPKKEITSIINNFESLKPVSDLLYFSLEPDIWKVDSEV